MVVYASIPDLLRLLVVPALGWAAWRDVETRRVPNDLWYPIALLGFVLVCWEGWLSLGGPGFRPFVIRTAISLLLVVPLAYGFWYFGGFGGADAKAFMVIALVYPTFPYYAVAGEAFPLVPTVLGVFSLTVLTNTVLLGLAYPIVLGCRNLLAGEFSWMMFVGRRVPVDNLVDVHGSLLEDPDGFTRNGLDLDALRMYLRWRGLTLSDVRRHPQLRDPATLPDEPNEPTDGAVQTDGGSDARTDEGSDVSVDANGDVRAGSDDPWGAAAFLDDIEGSAYGTTPEKLRGGLDVVVRKDVVWVTPGIPFLVPTFFGLVVALVFGDLLFAVMGLLGLV